MKTIQHAVFTLICCLCCAPVVAAPQLPVECKVFQPKLLQSYTVKESELTKELMPKNAKKAKWGQTANSHRYWTAYSDRSSNVTYNDATEKSGACGKLDFNQEVRIADIRDGFALVYTESESQHTTYPTISRSAKCHGWIPMQYLLLWSDCPTNDYGIYNKALIVGNIDKLKSNQHVGVVYKNPATGEGKANLRSSMNFFFVMKRDPATGLVLLAKESRVGGKIRDVLYGWVSEGMYAPWSQRTCMEPNWNTEVLSDLKGTKIPVYVSAKDRSVVTSIEMGARRNSVSSNNPATQYRLDPNMLRYPLLDNDRQNGLYKITAFAREGGAPAGDALDAAARAQGDMLASLDALRTVNIIMVIDGTKGMQKFFPVALEAIKRAEDHFGKENRMVRAGVVIYRDYADGEYVTEYLPMRNAKDATISDFLRKGGKYGVKSSPKDRTDYNALYKGLEVALDAKKMNYSALNSNLMFVIGDRGNDPADSKSLSQDAIVKRLADNHVQLLAFQVRNVQSKAYTHFRVQMLKVITENVKAQYAELGAGDKVSYTTLANGGFDTQFNADKESAFFIGSARYARNGGEIDAARLYKLVLSTSETFNDAISIMESKHTDEVIGDDAISAIDRNFLAGRISEAGLKALRQQKYLTAFEGFTPAKSSNNRDYWQPVIYISHPEYRQLMGKLKPVMEAADKGADDRTPYINALKELVRSMIPDISEAEMNRKGNSEVMNMVVGLNIRTEAMESHSLLDIENEEKVSRAQFEGIISQFGDRYKKLEKIEQSSYPFTTTRNGVKWYWIPAEDLP